MVYIDSDSAIANNSGNGEGKIHGNGIQHGLGEIVNKKDNTVAEKEGETKPAFFVSDIFSSQFSSETLPPTDMVVDQVQRLIDTMACYQQKLMEKKVSLKDIQALINKMATESESLSMVTKQLSATDSLRSIVNQWLILSSAEIVKFNSGVYTEG